jgi:hypothetical protein
VAFVEYMVPAEASMVSLKRKTVSVKRGEDEGKTLQIMACMVAELPQSAKEPTSGSVTEGAKEGATARSSTGNCLLGRCGPDYCEI